MGGGEEPLEGDSGREGRCPAEVVEAGRSGERGTRALALEIPVSATGNHGKSWGKWWKNGETW